MIKRLAALFTALLMVLSLAACGDNTADETTAESLSTTSYIREIKTNVAAAKDVTGFGVSKLAKDRDYAYDVTYCDDVQQVKELIKNGKADIAAMSISDAVALYNEGADIKILAVNKFVSMYVITKGVTVSDPSDLKNKTVYSMNTDEITEKFTKTILADNGIKYEELDIRIFENISEIAAEIEGKDEYVLMLTGAEASKLPKDSERKISLNLTLSWINQRKSLPVHSVVVARTDYINSKPEIIDEFRMFNEVSVNYILGNAESGAIHLYETEFFESSETAMVYVSEYCDLGYVEKEKMQKIVGESLEAYGDGTVSAQEITFIG